MFARTATSVIDVVSLLRLAIFKDFLSTLFSYAVNIGLTLAALLLMRRMHSAAYDVFYNFVTGALNPSVLIVMASLVIALIGAEFIFVGCTNFQKGYIPPVALKVIFSIRNSIVMQSGVVLALAVVMFADDPMSRWKAYATAVIYLASAYPGGVPRPRALLPGIEPQSRPPLAGGGGSGAHRPGVVLARHLQPGGAQAEGHHRVRGFDSGHARYTWSVWPDSSDR